MSQAIPPLETIRAGFDAFNRGDYDAWVAIYDEDVEFLDLAETPDTGVFHGRAGARAWLDKLQEAWGEGFRFEPQSITQGDDVVLVDTRASGVGGRKQRPDRDDRIHGPALPGSKGHLDSGLHRPSGGPRSRRAIGVGDVAGERGAGAEGF